MNSKVAVAAGAKFVPSDALADALVADALAEAGPDSFESEADVLYVFSGTRILVNDLAWFEFSVAEGGYTGWVALTVGREVLVADGFDEVWDFSVDAGAV